MAPPRRRKSALLRFAFGYAAFFCGSVVVLFVLLHTTLTEFMLREARNAVSQEIANIGNRNKVGIQEVKSYVKEQNAVLASRGAG